MVMFRPEKGITAYEVREAGVTIVEGFERDGRLPRPANRSAVPRCAGTLTGVSGGIPPGGR